jgi:DNA-binding transcriptional MerR regulator
MRAKPKFGGTAGLFEVIGEGGQAGFNVLRQGRKDIMQSEEAINAARAKMVEAEMLRDDRKYKASSDARKEAIELNNYGLNLAKTQSAIALQNVQAQVAAQEAPARQDLLRAQAEAYRTRGTTISDADQKAAEEYARGVLMQQNPPLLPGNPNYLPAFQTAVQQYLTQIRGAQGGIPAAAAMPTAIDYSQAINASVSGT